MAAVADSSRRSLVGRGLRLEYLTVGWNVFEGGLAIGAGLVARSNALVGFGVDSLVETISGLVMVWRLRSESTGSADEDDIERVEQRAERFVGLAFFVLAVYVAYEAIQALLSGERPDPSPVGVALTAVSIPVMLWLASAKRRVGRALHSRALIADAMQSQACWYLSVVTLAGLALNVLPAFWWADSVAALGISFLLVREGIEALRGEEEDEGAEAGEDEDGEDEDGEDEDGEDDNDEAEDAEAEADEADPDLSEAAPPAGEGSS